MPFYVAFAAFNPHTKEEVLAIENFLDKLLILVAGLRTASKKKQSAHIIVITSAFQAIFNLHQMPQKLKCQSSPIAVICHLNLERDQAFHRHLAVAQYYK
ncbi:hypothetical protein [Streptococcus macedonicus]|uniref:hypothetical protein n=1 Tax=Streptococcus macedonicus TaxID=59310 RepID=UPI00202A296B|nr:hypothetical protein [Streptococcus macedonicus]